MSELLLDSLEIKGYRCFEHLTIEKLGRVNLIVGKNNVGKTALLEALWVYANGGDLRSLMDSLYTREEIPFIPDQMGNVMLAPFIDSFKSISSLDPNFEKKTKLFEFIINKKFKLSESVGRLLDETSNPSELGEKVIKTIPNFPLPLPPEILLMTQFEYLQATDKVEYNFFNLERTLRLTNVSIPKFNSEFLKFRGTSINNITRLWEQIVKKNFEEKVIEILQIIDNTIRAISFVGLPSGSQNLIPMIKIDGKPEKVTLRSYGDGLTRLLEVILTLVGSENGACMIDEIDIGLHYSILPDVWKLIFKTAKDLNVQVFATTHSKDCIEAFNEVANANDEKDDGMLIRLERQGEKIIAKTVAEERLALAIEHGVEMR